MENGCQSKARAINLKRPDTVRGDHRGQSENVTNPIIQHQVRKWRQTSALMGSLTCESGPTRQNRSPNGVAGLQGGSTDLPGMFGPFCPGTRLPIWSLSRVSSRSVLIILYLPFFIWHLALVLQIGLLNENCSPLMRSSISIASLS